MCDEIFGSSRETFWFFSDFGFRIWVVSLPGGRTFFTFHRTRALRGRAHVLGVRAAAPACKTPSQASRRALGAQNEVGAQVLRDEPAGRAARAVTGGVSGKCAGRAEERAGVVRWVPDDDPVPEEGRCRPHPHAHGGRDEAGTAAYLRRPGGPFNAAPSGPVRLRTLAALPAVFLDRKRARAVV